MDTGLKDIYWSLLVTGMLYNVMGVTQSVSISGADINLTLRAITTYVLCCNLAPSMSALKRCIFWFFKHCRDMTGFLLWIGKCCISCVVQQTSRVKDLSSLVRYDDSCLAAIRHVQSITRVELRPNIRSHSVLLYLFCWHKDQNKGIKPCQVGISGIVDCSWKLVATIEP